MAKVVEKVIGRDSRSNEEATWIHSISGDDADIFPNNVHVYLGYSVGDEPFPVCIGSILVDLFSSLENGV